jgi:hypothetical protein
METSNPILFGGGDRSAFDFLSKDEMGEMFQANRNTPVSVQVDGLGPGCRRAESMSNPATPPDPLKAAAERDESAPSSQAPGHRNHTQTQTQHHKRNTSHEIPPNPIARLLD